MLLAAAVALLLAVAVLAGGAHLASDADAQRAVDPPLRVSMFGDSVLLGARDALLAQFSGQPVTVDAMEDRSLLGAISLFQSAGPALGDVVVLDLGYNDASDPTVFLGRIDDAMHALAAVRRVFWLNQHDWGPGRAGMNAELVAATARYPNLEVIDWNAEVSAHPDEVYADSIHLTPAGQTAMANLVRLHYDQWIESLTPTTTSTTKAVPTSTTGATPTRSGRTAAAKSSDGDVGVGLDRRSFLIGAVVVVLLLAAGAALSLGRRARRRAARRSRRGRRRGRSRAGGTRSAGTRTPSPDRRPGDDRPRAD